MNINSTFPFPVLGNSTDYSFNEFSLNIRERMIGGHHEFKGTFDFGSMHDDLEKLLSEKSISFTVLVRCASTYIRQYFTSNEKSIIFSIPVGSLKGRIEFTCYIFVDRNINKFTPIHQNKEFFFESSYDLQTGDIIGISNTLKWNYFPDFKGRSKSNKKNIIRIGPDESSKKDHFKVSAWGTNQLYVGIPRKWWRKFEPLKKSEYEIFHKSTFILPVLSEAISKYKSDDGEQYKGLKWYEVIENELNERDLIDKDLDCLILAQILLEGPLKHYINNLKYIDDERLIED